jgi:toxin FitB
MIILDTNVLSEAFRPKPAESVLQWLGSQSPRSVYITAITQAEILYGIETLPAGKRRMSLSEAVERVFADEFAGRILSFDEEAARVFPKIVTARDELGRPISQFDAMIASIARSHHSAVATRNPADFEHCGIRTVNPWTG